LQLRNFLAMRVIESVINKSNMQQNPMQRLRKQWILVTIMSAAAALAGSVLLFATWHPDYALRWLLFALTGCAYLSGFLWTKLSENHRVDESQVLPSFGAGNALTMLRGILLALLFGFIASPRPAGWLAWLPASVYTMAAILDPLDGYLARVTNYTTRMGESLDLKLDGLGVFVAAILAVRYGQAPAWYLLVGIARYLFVGGIWLRKRLGKPIYRVPESPHRRPFAGAQMGLLAVILWPVFSPPGTHLVATVFAVPFLVGFGWDWLAVSGAIRPDDSRHAPGGMPGADRAAAFRRQFLSTWLPLILRVSLVAVLVLVLTHRLPRYFQELLSPSSLFAVTTNWNIMLSLLLLFFGTLLLALGAAGRMATLAIMFSVGLHQHISAPGIIDFLILTAASALFYLGTGAFSLWKPEDGLIRKRLGEV
jgi:CDP-diacylglycerol--glycerol-3-phosphate 3-phosphatidyltransferase